MLSGCARFLLVWDQRGLPLWLLILVLIVVPVCIGLFFGIFTFKHMAPNLFYCRRCNRDFQHKAWRRFPPTCPLCDARDWNQ